MASLGSPKAWTDIVPSMASVLSDAIGSSMAVAFTTAERAWPESGLAESAALVAKQKSSIFAKIEPGLNKLLLTVQPIATAAPVVLSLMSDEDLKSGLTRDYLFSKISDSGGLFWSKISVAAFDIGGEDSGHAALAPRPLSDFIENLVTQIGLDESAHASLLRAVADAGQKPIAAALSEVSTLLTKKSTKAIPNQPGRPGNISDLNLSVTGDGSAPSAPAFDLPGLADIAIPDAVLQSISGPLSRQPTTRKKTRATNRSANATAYEQVTRMRQHERLSIGWTSAISQALIRLFAPVVGRISERITQDEEILQEHIDETVDDVVELVSRRRALPDNQVSLDAAGALVKGDSKSFLPDVLVWDILTDFQQDLPPAIIDSATRADRSISSQVKISVLSAVATKNPESAGAALSLQADDAIDIVGMMFEMFLADRPINASVHTAVTKMLPAYIKLAMSDRKIFMDKQHPARRLMNAIAEACDGNHGDNPVEVGLLDVSIQAAALASSFKDTAEVFKKGEANIREAMATAKQNVDKAEKRALEAQQGKDRQDLARSTAESFFEEKTASWPSSATALLRPYWVHFKTISILRDATLDVADADRLLVFMASKQGYDIPDHLRSAWSRIIIAMLAASGISENESKDIMGHIWTEIKAKASDDVDQDQSSNAVASIKPPPVSNKAQSLLDDLKKNIALLGVADDEQPEVSEKVVSQKEHQIDQKTNKVLDAAGKASLLEYFKTMDINTWVDFVDEATGQIKPGKLSWISPISLRMMFVDRKGARLAVETAEDLVPKVINRTVRLRIDHPAFDQSLRAAILFLSEDLPEDSRSPFVPPAGSKPSDPASFDLSF